MSNVSKKLSFLADDEELVSRKMYEVKLAELVADPNQPRKYFDEEAMDELVKSIDKHGILQPVMFRRDDKGDLIIISGERRFQAAKKANLEKIPAIYNDSENIVEIALVENLLRENLNPIEEAEALYALKEERGYKNVEISDVIGKAESTISEILSLNKLPDSIKDECRQNPNCTRRGLVEIAKADDEEMMLALFEKYKKKELEREEVRAARGDKGSKEVDWEKKVEGFGKQIGKIDFEELGDQAAVVVKALKDLMKTIKGALPATK